MSGGNKSLVLNTRERIVSSDHNRLQAFSAYERAELLRYQLSPQARPLPLANDKIGVESGGYADTLTALTITTPATADVYDGLVVLPQAGTLNLLVSPGIIGIIDPDGQAGSSDPSAPSTDDSPYKIVNDPGVLIAGALVIAAGAGSTRIDLVECRRQTVVLETDSRDIFDPSTGVFAPVTVTKVKAGRLLYRVTQGTPGGGIPARSQGWTPLMVASVPSSATIVDNMTFWDVRPAVHDRINPGSAVPRFFPRLETESIGLLADDGNGTNTFVTGVAMSSIGMYRAGGQILALDARAAANQAAGYSPVTAQPWYLYAVFPAGLPRWVKYQNAPPLIPANALGVLTVSEQGPVSGADHITPSVNPPVATGLVTAGPAALLAAGSFITPSERGFIVASGGMTYLGAGQVIAFTPSSVMTSSDFYDIPATKFPRGAKSLLLEVNTTYHDGGGGAGDAAGIVVTIALLRTSAGTRIINMVPFGATFSVPNPLDVVVTVTVEVPIVPYAPENAYDGDCHIFADWSITSGSRGSSNCRIYGWRI